MDATFSFVLIAPAARSWVLARFHGRCAGHAADGGIAPAHQRMPGQAVFLHVGPDVVTGPMGQRVDLDAARAVLDLEEVEGGAGAGLIAFAPGDPAVETGKRTLQGPGLAQGAAGVGIASV